MQLRHLAPIVFALAALPALTPVHAQQAGQPERGESPEALDDTSADDANAKSLSPLYSVLTTITGVDLTYGVPALSRSAGIFAFADIKRLWRH